MRAAVRAVVRAVALIVAFAAVLPAATALGADAFEIQVYDGTANPVGTFGLELHVNDAIDGIKTSPPPELPPHHLLHVTLEPSLGVTRFWEIGAYIQTALRPDGGGYEFAGAKLRSKLVTPAGWQPHLRLGLNMEAGRLLARYAPERWGGELRPIVAWEDARWLLAVNPIVGVPLTGGAATFEPAALALVKLGVLSAGLEYYGDLGPIVTSGQREASEHTLFEVVNLLSLPNLELQAGLGEGLTSSSSRLTAKVIVGYVFERAAAPGEPRASAEMGRASAPRLTAPPPAPAAAPR
jgi:hypothetical protein